MELHANNHFQVFDMTQKYYALAKKNGAIMIPQNGVESAPPDLMCWMLASHIRSTLSSGTAEVVSRIHTTAMVRV